MVIKAGPNETILHLQTGHSQALQSQPLVGPTCTCWHPTAFFEQLNVSPFAGLTCNACKPSKAYKHLPACKRDARGLRPMIGVLVNCVMCPAPSLVGHDTLSSGSGAKREDRKTDSAARTSRSTGSEVVPVQAATSIKRAPSGEAPRFRECVEMSGRIPAVRPPTNKMRTCAAAHAIVARRFPTFPGRLPASSLSRRADRSGRRCRLRNRLGPRPGLPSALGLGPTGQGPGRADAARCPQAEPPADAVRHRAALASACRRRAGGAYVGRPAAGSARGGLGAGSSHCLPESML